MSSQKVPLQPAPADYNNPNAEALLKTYQDVYPQALPHLLAYKKHITRPFTSPFVYAYNNLLTFNLPLSATEDVTKDKMVEALLHIRARIGRNFRLRVGPTHLLTTVNLDPDPADHSFTSEQSYKMFVGGLDSTVEDRQVLSAIQKEGKRGKQGLITRALIRDSASLLPLHPHSITDLESVHRVA